MKQRIAIKRLSASDLTLFEHHFRNTAGTKQKAFNLDRSVFIDLLYPSLPDSLDVSKDRIPLDLSIFGPGLAGLHNLQRKILKQQKNWRLNGELIYSPPEVANRYDPLQKGDFAIICFAGETAPQSARLYLVAQTLPEDSVLHTKLEERYAHTMSSRKSMEVVELDELVALIDSLDLNDLHPVLDLADADILEDAVLGGSDGLKRIRRRRNTRGVGRDEFERARKSAETVGRLGEELLNAELEQSVTDGNIPGYRWESDINAVAPYDFLIVDGENVIRSIDAKSTSGAFSNHIHVSAAELEEMVYGGRPYDLYRLYSVRDNTAMYRIAKDVGVFAESVLKALEVLPGGVTVDSVSIDPRNLTFGEELLIDLRETSIHEERDQQPLFDE